jgi:hypothetical protein
MWEKAILIWSEVGGGRGCSPLQEDNPSQKGKTAPQSCSRLRSSHPRSLPSCHATENASAAAPYGSSALAPRDRAIP